MRPLRQTQKVGIIATYCGIMEIVGRPEAINCARCGTSVTVKAKGPVPAFCSQCRGRGKRARTDRPATVACERCDQPISVGARGPLPRFCRGGCKQTNTTHADREPTELPLEDGWVGSLPLRETPPEPRPGPSMPDAPAAARNPAPLPAPAPEPDREQPPAPASSPAPAGRAPATAQPQPAPPPSQPPAPSPAARAPAPATAVLNRPSQPVFDERALLRGRRLSRIRSGVKIAAWILAVLLLVSIVMLGSRPNPPDFESLTGYLT